MNVNAKPAFSFALFLLVAGCKPVNPPSGDECDRAFGHLVDVGCEPARPESGTWVDACRNGRANGVFGLRCVNAATTRELVSKCGVTCQ